jgi:hypothetical protein
MRLLDSRHPHDCDGRDDADNHAANEQQFAMSAMREAASSDGHGIRLAPWFSLSAVAIVIIASVRGTPALISNWARTGNLAR